MSLFFIDISQTSRSLRFMVHNAWLVRHGESTWNALGLAQGHCDQARLTRHGEYQAWVVAARLRSPPIGAL